MQNRMVQATRIRYQDMWFQVVVCTEQTNMQSKGESGRTEREAKMLVKQALNIELGMTS